MRQVSDYVAGVSRHHFYPSRTSRASRLWTLRSEFLEEPAQKRKVQTASQVTAPWRQRPRSELWEGIWTESGTRARSWTISWPRLVNTMVIQITARAEERHQPKVSSMARLARVARVDRPLDRPKFLQAGSSPIAHQVEKFLDRCSQRWQKHTADAQKEETELTEQIETARTALANAVRSFEDSKTELGDQVVDVEAHAAMMEDSEKKDKDTVGAALHESIATMKSQSWRCCKPPQRPWLRKRRHPRKGQDCTKALVAHLLDCQRHLQLPRRPSRTEISLFHCPSSSDCAEQLSRA